ncbi:hypothetical protein B0T24DRAFT_632487 [Lasiosphaeria ovina]|uniref:Secreted protein n=1 Tax=Lasiosphaeria ovina TaxID=92902 RepID=A0AAE0K4U9_9PEZI|nr:hypothetical protein B0T24DRAFT_632487 [Lasiosphaeria ovina]
MLSFNILTTWYNWFLSLRLVFDSPCVCFGGFVGDGGQFSAGLPSFHAVPSSKLILARYRKRIELLQRNACSFRKYSYP